VVRKYWFKIHYKLGCTIKATLSLIMVNRENFQAHYQGPDLRNAIDDYINWLKWEYKGNRKIEPWEAREKLAEFLDDRGVNV
jgi:hypothetical protein